jgi:Uri superfamily endonuclease
MLKKFQAYYFAQKSGSECEILHQFKQDYSKSDIVVNFGSSDCRSKCRGHLLYLSNNQEELFHLNDYFLQRGWLIYNYSNENISD